MEIFTGYVKRFQAEKPLMHKVHADLFAVSKEFFSQFVDPEHIPIDDVDKLTTLKSTDSDLQLSDRQLGVGASCFGALKACLSHNWHSS